jgi:hypothetical protein
MRGMLDVIVPTMNTVQGKEESEEPAKVAEGKYPLAT